MIEEQIRDRYKTILENADFNSDLLGFLENDFSPAFNTILSKSKKLWPGNFKNALTINHQLLSPSDFGFHNTLLVEERLKFIDFEYFGWDDPVKLTCDFMLHPGMVLTDKQKTLWLKMMRGIFSNDNTFPQRLTASYGLYGLCWCLIILNVFKKNKQGEKSIKGLIKSDFEQKQTEQLGKSIKQLKHINEIHKHGLPYE